MSVRTGIGYDCHRFQAGRRLVLGCVAVEHVRGLSVSDGVKTAILHDTAQKLLPGGVG